MEARLLQQLELADVAEAEDLIDEAGIAASADAPTAVLVLVDEGHPEAVLFLPLNLVLGGPAIPVGAVAAALRREIVPHRFPGVILVPIGLACTHQVAVGVVDGEGR